MTKGRLVWIILAVFTLFLRWALSGHPHWIEAVYSRGLFSWIRPAIDYSLGWFPFPWIYLFILIVLGYTAWAGRRIVLAQSGWASRWWRLGWLFSAVISYIIVSFMWLWGFNYGRIPVERQLGLELKQPAYDAIRQALDEETAAIISLRAQIPGATSRALELSLSKSALENQLRKELTRVLKQNGYPATGRMRVFNLLPKGIFLRFSSAGLYFPFTGQGHIDAGLHSLQWPHTMAHEMAHGYGIAEEGACNFWAYLACRQSAVPAIAYMGRLSYWRSLAIYFKIKEPEAYARFRAALPPGVIADLEAINKNLLAYPDIAPRIRDHTYDAYLKSQGLHDGMANYDKDILLIEAWKKKNQNACQ